MSEDVVIVGGARTPFCEWVGGKRGDGKAGGALKTVSAQELGAIAIQGALEKSGTAADAVDHVVMGYALQTCSQSIYGARHAGLKAGIPQEVPMLTLSRICGSGIQSIVSGAQMIMLGEAKTVVSGGMENLSQAPHILRGARDGWKLGRSPKVEDYMMTNLQDMTCGLFMAQTSDELCRRKGVTREEIDTFAALSHARTTTSIEHDVFEQEIVPVTIKSRRGETVSRGPRAQVRAVARQGGDAGRGVTQAATAVGDDARDARRGAAVGAGGDARRRFARSRVVRVSRRVARGVRTKSRIVDRGNRASARRRREARARGGRARPSGARLSG